jgi:uncharacterized membrane protein YfcA
VPVYAVTDGVELTGLGPLIGLATAGVIVGTLIGERVLSAIPERAFRVVVATLLVGLGLLVLGTA